jgi:hypothetical protein
MKRLQFALPVIVAVFFGVLTLPALVERANANPVGLGATDNATIEPSGPRAGTNGKIFFNMEGSNNGSFASFGVADFDYSVIPPGHLPQASSIIDAELDLTEDVSGFSVAGPISVYYTANTGVSIQPGASPLTFQAGHDGAAAVDPALGPLTLLGSGIFADAGTGIFDKVPLSFTGGASSGFLNAFNNGTTLRLVVTADSASTTATFVGVGNGSDVLLKVDYVAAPEPGSLALLAIGALCALLGARMRSHG